MNTDFFKITTNNVKPKRGMVLVSEPFSRNSFFGRSVVLLTEHNADGSIGFILNKPVHLKLNEVLIDFPELDISVSMGGPVQTNSIHFIHTLGDAIPDSIKITNNIYWGGNIDQLKLLMETKIASPKQVRFFIGYSGWGKDQLNKELADNFWVVTKLVQSEIFSPSPPDTWKVALSNMEQKYKLWTTYPENPELN